MWISGQPGRSDLPNWTMMPLSPRRAPSWSNKFARQIMKEEKNDLMEKIVSLSKRRGFIFQGSEIYGGLAGTYDWGHFGVALKNNIKQNWWKKFVDARRDMY